MSGLGNTPSASSTMVPQWVQRYSAPAWSFSKDNQKDFLHAGHATRYVLAILSYPRGGACGDTIPVAGHSQTTTTRKRQLGRKQNKKGENESPLFLRCGCPFYFAGAGSFFFRLRCFCYGCLRRLSSMHGDPGGHLILPSFTV